MKYIAEYHLLGPEGIGETTSMKRGMSDTRRKAV